MEGSNGDLFPVRFIQANTVVSYVEMNEPLQDLHSNIQILDAKVADLYANGVGSGGGGSPSPSPSASTTATVSKQVNAVYDAPPAPAPADTTIGTDIPAKAFVHNADEAQKLIVTVPTDYVADGLAFYVDYQMSAGAAGNVSFDIEGEIAHVSGSISTIGPTSSSLAVNNNTNPGEALLYLVTDGTFDPGDVIRITFTRTNGDANTATIKIGGIYYSYTGYVSLNRGYTFQPEVLYDSAETPATVGTYGTDLISYDFPDSGDTGQRIVGIVPQEWDEMSDPFIKFTYAMGGSTAGKVVRLEYTGTVANIDTGMQTLSTVIIDNAVANDTDPHQTIAASFDASYFSPGSVFNIDFARRTGVTDDSPEDFRIIGAEVVFGSASTGSSVGLNGEHFLTDPVYSSVGDVDVSSVIHSFSSIDHYALDVMGVTASQSLTIQWMGRLSSTESELSRLRIEIDKTVNAGTYRLRIYPATTGSSASYDSGSQTLSVGVTSLSIGSALISPQPDADGPYIVKLDVTTGAATSDHIYIQRPYVLHG